MATFERNEKKIKDQATYLKEFGFGPGGNVMRVEFENIPNVFFKWNGLDGVEAYYWGPDGAERYPGVYVVPGSSLSEWEKLVRWGRKASRDEKVKSAGEALMNFAKGVQTVETPVTVPVESVEAVAVDFVEPAEASAGGVVPVVPWARSVEVVEASAVDVVPVEEEGEGLSITVVCTGEAGRATEGRNLRLAEWTLRTVGQGARLVTSNHYLNKTIAFIVTDSSVQPVYVDGDELATWEGAPIIPMDITNPEQVASVWKRALRSARGVSKAKRFDAVSLASYIYQ